MKITPEIHEFFVEGGDPDESHALLHITEPSTAEEMPKGYFFALAEIEDGSTAQIEHLQQMIEDMESAYYEAEEKTDKDPFETTLEFINRRGHHVLQDNKDGIHCIVGVLRGSDVLFAYHGAPQVHLFYQGKNGLEHLPVVEEAGEEQSDQLFSALMQGSINPGDSMIVTTPQVSDFFPPDRMEKLLSSRNAEETAAHVQKVLGDTRGDVSFAGVIFHLPKQRSVSVATDGHDEAVRPDSIVKLQDTRQATAEMLSPPLFGDTKKKLQSLLKGRNAEAKLAPIPDSTQTPDEETNVRPRAKRRDESVASTILVALGRAIVIGALGLVNAVRNVGILFVRMAVGGFYLLTNAKNKRRDVITSWKRYIHEKRTIWRALPALSKILLIGTIVCALIFVGSISYLKYKEREGQKAQAYLNLVASVKDRKEAADGSLVYGNEAKAMSLLQEAKDLLKTLPTDNKDQQTTRDDLANGIENSLQKLRKVITVAPTLIVDLTQTQPTATANKLAQIDDQLIAYGKDDSSLYRVDIAGKKAEAKTHDPLFHLSFASTPKEQDTIVFGTEEGLIAEYNKDNGMLSTKTITFPTEHTVLADAVVYNQKLYMLETGSKHIYKFARTGTGYDKGAVWSKNGEDKLGEAVSLAIDGDVFVLTNTGAIKYVSGVPQDFPLDGLDPALDHPTAIWTYNDVNNIYILEPTNKRVIVLNKLGKLLAQYTSPLFTHPTDMIVNEAKHTIYVIDSNKVYSFKIN